MIAQALSIFVLNTRSSVSRPWPGLLVVLGIGGAIGVFMALWSMAAGLDATFASTGSADRALVLRAGSTSEINGNIPRSSFNEISRLPQVQRLNDQPLAAMETYVTVTLPTLTDGVSESLPLRGISETSFMVRPEVRILEGRRPDQGKFELLAGRVAAREFRQLQPGDEITIKGRTWRVTGTFGAANGAYESELWVPERLLAQLWQRGDTFSSLLVQLTDATVLSEFQTQLDDDKRLNVHAFRESTYYANQSASTAGLIRGAAIVVATIMGLGALFAVLNSLNAALTSRRTEMGTLRALGFRRVSIVIAVLLEAMVLGVAGALLGAGAVILLLGSLELSTVAATSSSFTQVGFKLLISPELIGSALVGAATLAVLGCLPPLAAALRKSIAESLRQD